MNEAGIHEERGASPDWPPTVPAALVSTTAIRPDEPALRWRGAGGWSSWTWRDYADRVSRLAAGLSELGVGRGERILLMTHNRPEFHAVDMAALAVGAVPVSVYNSSSAEQLRYVADHAEAVVAVVEAEYLGRVFESGDRHTRLRHLVVLPGLDAAGRQGADTQTQQGADAQTQQGADSGAQGLANGLPDVVAFDRLLGTVAVDLRAQADRARPDDLATLIYTSGTTGPPKAVEITHANVAWTVRSIVEAVGHPVAGWQMVSCLPMAHIAERVATHYLHAFEGTEVTTCHDARFVLEYLREVHPRAVLSVPLLWEKAYASIKALAAANPEQREPFEAALEVGRDVAEARSAGRSLDPSLARRWADADRQLSLIRGLLGLDRAEIAVSAAAPIAPEVVAFFRALGVPLSELYGMSESTGPISWDPYRVRPGDVGHPIPGCDVRLAEDGEVLARGGNVFAGYYKDPARTARTIDADGWLHTGDLGVIEDGRLRIVGRKKDLIVTEGGENVSPSNIETALRSAPLVDQACVAGDRKPYLVALLTLDPDAVNAWARAHNRSGMTMKELVHLPDLRAEVELQVADVNRRFSRVEQVRRVAVLDDAWPADSEMLTATMKVKRDQVLAKYSAEVDALYS